jgi:hypothetical protein
MGIAAAVTWAVAANQPETVWGGLRSLGFSLLGFVLTGGTIAPLIVGISRWVNAVQDPYGF